MAAARERRVPKTILRRVFSTGLLFRERTWRKTNDRKLSSCRCDSRWQSRKASENSPRWNLWNLFLSYLQLFSVSSSSSSSFCRLVMSFFNDSFCAHFHYINHPARGKITWQNKFGRAICQWASWHWNLHFSSLLALALHIWPQSFSLRHLLSDCWRRYL